MMVSYEGIGLMCATFACGEIEDGALVKVSANGTVATCAADEVFCGVVAARGRDKKACSVQLGGFVTLAYTGTPTLGYCALAANGAGGVKDSADGRECLVVAKDETAGTVTIML